MIDMKKLEHQLREKDLRITSHRKAILEAFLHEAKHLLTAAEVLTLVMEQGVKINFSTVYRNLEALTEKEILKRYNLDNGINYYELDVHEHHHHLICLDCGDTQTIFKCPIEAFKKEIEQTSDFIPVEHKLEIYGYCKTCRGNAFPLYKKT